MSDGSLTNHLLIAMPSLADPNFSQSVTLICEHTEKGALGIVLNKPLPMKLLDVLSQMKLEPKDLEIGTRPVLRGGPMSTDRGRCPASMARRITFADSAMYRPFAGSWALRSATSVSPA